MKNILKTYIQGCAFLFLAALVFCGTLRCLEGPAHAQEAKHHTIDFTQTLKGVDGKAIENGDVKNPAPLTLGDVATGALMGVLDTDRNEDGAAKFKRGELAHRIYKAKSIELTVEEVALIKERIGKAYGPLVVYAAWPLLDPATK